MFRTSLPFIVALGALAAPAVAAADDLEVPGVITVGSSAYCDTRVSVTEGGVQSGGRDVVTTPALTISPRTTLEPLGDSSPC